MKHSNKKVELLAPAGNFEKLEIAIHYGADAVYLAGKHFSLRNLSGNFTCNQLEEAVHLAHENGVRVYVACNIYARNADQALISEFLRDLGDIKPDAVIISDPGILMQARKIIPDIPIHLSTQANTTNYRTAQFWEHLGVKRINTARELSLGEIREISDRCGVEIEAFVHGAMCISYSGRCLLSSFMAGRDSNLGQCCHPCRWKYAVMEETRPGQFMPIIEDDRGSYVFNSRDLCMIEHVPDMIRAGIESLKIEGRMKSIHYLASTVKVYREAIDTFYEADGLYRVNPEWMSELSRISHRSYSTGFYLDDPEQARPDITKSIFKPAFTFCAKVLEPGDSLNQLAIEVRNKIHIGECIEVFRKSGPTVPDRILDIIDADGLSIPFAQPGSRVTVKLNDRYERFDLIRRPNVTIE